MKRIIALILAAVMITSAAACSRPEINPTEPSPHPKPTTEAAETEAPGTEPEPAAERVLPETGETVEGFTVKEIREFPMIGADIVWFEHERTGARLMYIANNDNNRVFDLTFFTRAIDNTGLPHVFEHSTLDGSAKYPSKALFFNLSYQTYNTYMNAMTAPLSTTYPVASLSEEQLLKYADYYTDSCFNPMIMEDKSIFLEEAWRYRLASADDPLTIEGTVYSEMLGARDLSSASYTNFLRAAFPGSTIGNVSGGEPENIPEMTWEALQDYHNNYYHPSNCTAYLYGQFDDYAAFLRLLDEAFAPYEKREFTFDDAAYVPLTASVETSAAFPVEAGSSTDHASSVFYAYVCPGLKDSPEEELVLNTLTDLMTADGSSLMQSLKKALPSGSFSTYIELDGPEDMIVFYAQNVNAEDAPTFRDTVEAGLADIAANGFPGDLVDGVVSSLELSTKLTGEEDDLGVNLIDTVASYYASTGDPFGYMGYVDALDTLKDLNEQGLYQKAVTDWLSGDKITVLSTTYPEPGLREKLDAQEAERLAGVKAAMTPEELQEIIDRTNAEDEEDDASEYVKQLQAVTVSSLPEEIRTYDVSDETGSDGVRYVNAQADVDGVGTTALLLDASGLPQEDILWFALYTSLLGEMDTASHTRDELALLSTRCLYDGEIRLSLIDKYGTDEFKPYLRAGWTAADGDLAAGYDLMYEILFETDFSDEENLLGLITNAKASLKTSITNEPYNMMLYRALGYYSPLYRYYSYFRSIDYYAFLETAEGMMEDYPPAVIKKLERIQAYFKNRVNAMAVYAGSADGIAANAPLAQAFMAKLDSRDITPVAYELPQPARREALIIDSNVQYNAVVADYETLAMDGYTGDLDAVSSILSDAFLYPMLRDKYGAYGVMTGFIEDAGAYVVSYRDPNVTETFDVYDQIPAFMKDIDMEQEELDGYILSSYSYYAKGEGELAGALSAALSALTGEGQGTELEYMRDLKGLTSDTLSACADAYEKLCGDGLVFTAGGAAAINANADLYDEILNPFGAVDSTEIELEDVPEGHEHYDAVRFVFENKMMLPVTDTVFGVDDNATYGDMAIALYVLGIEDISDPQEAIDALAEYGITDASVAPDTALTAKTADNVLAAFSKAVQVDYTRDSSAGDNILSRGELAEIITAYTEPLMEE